MSRAAGPCTAVTFFSPSVTIIAPLGAHQHLVLANSKSHIDELCWRGRPERRLVDEVGEVGAGEAGGAPRQHPDVDVVGHRDLWVWTARMPSRPLTSGRLTMTRRSKRRDGAAPGRGRRVAAIRMTPRRLEAVHLDEQLVERLLALVVAAAEPGAAVAADGRSVDEDDAGRVLLPPRRSRTRGADADEHLDEVRAADREEWHAPAPATARASSVLPVPGGPISSTPFGAAELLNLGLLRN